MRRSTHYVFHAVWDVSAGFDDVCTVLSHPETYSAWWPEIRSVTPRASGRFEMVARSVLPYDLRFVSEEVEESPPAAGVIPARLTGDLDGYARFTVEPVAGGCRVVYDQEVDTHKAMLDRLAPLARPAFRANHALMMRHGRDGLNTFLAGYLWRGRGVPA